ncbi:hypothetical protein C8A03DRAFT_32531 [Achaetomium macrosporum]|uniref:Uncharacterized protein n=1 Tax=Achaetomium macrosporum TaxID=79813 RepID=A0AAN7CCC4_9PEZI|nr:hypothetical protein C8A03DRAFT_32531 [Achaetomium macrosporum]
MCIIWRRIYHTCKHVDRCPHGTPISYKADLCRHYMKNGYCNKVGYEYADDVLGGDCGCVEQRKNPYVLKKTKPEKITGALCPLCQTEYSFFPEEVREDLERRSFDEQAVILGALRERFEEHLIQQYHEDGLWGLDPDEIADFEEELAAREAAERGNEDQEQDQPDEEAEPEPLDDIERAFQNIREHLPRALKHVWYPAKQPEQEATGDEAVGDVWLTNLYDRSMVCSDCFLNILHRRLLLNPGLADGDWTDYLIAQHSDLQTYCSTSMPLTGTTTSSLVLGTMPIPTAFPSVTGTGKPTTSGPAASTTCAGTLMTPPSEAGVTCHMLSEQYNVTTGDLTVLTNDWDYQFTEPVCLPPPYQIMMIGWMETCEFLAQKVSTGGANITVVQFGEWSPRIIGPCDNIPGNQYICASPQGGIYVPPPPVHASPTTSAKYYTTA